MIELKDIWKTYRLGSTDFHALKNVSLSIQAGETVAIMGKSGAGKTTLMNIIGCLDIPSRGNYQLNNVSVNGLKDKQLSRLRNDTIGFVLQDFALLMHKTVLFNVMLPMYFDNTPFHQIKPAAIEALKKVEMLDQCNKKANQLSGGQKQRVAIARAIVKSPKILLADEPTGALDSETGKNIMHTLLTMNQYGTTVIIVTHDAQVASYCDRIITISDGVILKDQAFASF